MTISNQRYLKCEPVHLNKVTTIMLGSDYAERFAYDPEKPFTEFIEAIGGDIVIPVSGLKYANTTLIVDGPGNFTICLNPTYYRYAMPSRMGLAKRLAFYMLHSQLGQRPIKLSDTEYDLNTFFESQWFAVGFLTPLQYLTEKQQAGLGYHELATYFNVPVACIHERLGVR